MMKTKFNNAEMTGRKSLTREVLTSGTYPDVIAFMWVSGDRAAIFNQSVPYVRFYTDGVEVSVRHIERGHPVTGEVSVGREYTYGDILAVYRS